MRRLVRGLKAVYDFFTGDAIMLSATVVAFAAAFILVRTARANVLAAAAFIFLIVAGLVATLLRELADRPR
jgi:hypothetical protein